ncbi:MAG: efflux RND transporter permease subunit, partial [Planctomycetes bacterium]|nr:efflux RND transporter permease subunit [Planctomycetota bacterium]
NAVLIIDHMAQLVKEGMNAGEAMLQAITLEFRPIVMITIAATLGMWPLATAVGLGSEMTTPIGMSSVGGIIVSGLLTLLVIPVVFLVLHPPIRDDAPPDAEVYEKVRRTSTRFFKREISHDQPAQPPLHEPPAPEPGTGPAK